MPSLAPFPFPVRTLAQFARPASQMPPPQASPFFLHKVPCGFPSPAADYVEQGLDLNTYLVRNKAASYFFTVEGESMRDAGILHGDVLLVDRSVEPVHGAIVVAVIHNEYTVKRLYRMDGIVELRPENPAYPPIQLKEGEELLVWGVVIGVARRVT